eukprot:INCI15017.5.p2 GENE.INCI15017.5~~INCI15017.5.p2  ORF type:complete len:656 (+),score=82.53 INCI15017.5:118-2085(+)
MLMMLAGRGRGVVARSVVAARTLGGRCAGQQYQQAGGDDVVVGRHALRTLRTRLRHFCAVPGRGVGAGREGTGPVSGSSPAARPCFAGCVQLLGERHFSTFVSSHYQVDEAEITAYLKRKGCVWRAAGPERLTVKECPFCHPTRGKPDNLWKLYVRRQDGAFFCHRCGASGSWFDFKKRNGDIQGMGMGLAGAGSSSGGTGNDRQSTSSPRHQEQHQHQHQHQQRPVKMLESHKAARASWELLNNPENKDVVRYLTETRGLSPKVLEQYGVGCVEASFITSSGQWQKQKCITFPWTDRARASKRGQERHGGADGPTHDKINLHIAGDSATAFRMKLRGLEHKGNQRLDPAGGAWGFFGWHLVPEDATSLVICEGEFDAMAVYQATGVPAVSLPNGCRSLPVELLPKLERFEEVLLWMDNDTPGQEGAQQFAAKLGKNRCLLVQPPSSLVHAPKDANEALKMGLDLQFFLDTAQPIPHEQIVTFRELRSQILSEIESPESVSGTPYTSLPSLQKITRGHRRGEVTLMTGPTGAGKTTMLSQLSLDLCAQGVSTLWGSFEVKNTRLMQKMLHQFAGMGLAFGAPQVAGQKSSTASAAAMDKETLHEVAECFEDLPLYFLRCVHACARALRPFLSRSPPVNSLLLVKVMWYPHARLAD